MNSLSHINLVETYAHNQKNLLSEIRVKSKTFGDRVFEKMIPTLWNKLPDKIRHTTDFGQFKYMLKTHLFLKMVDCKLIEIFMSDSTIIMYTRIETM